MRTALEKPTLKDQLAAADTLAAEFQSARDKNLHYAFWSNMALVPLAAAATASVAFHASKGAVAGLGIGSAGLIGANAFVSARPNAKVYQAGLSSLTCEIVNLKPYDGTPPPDYVGLTEELSQDQPLSDVSGVAQTSDLKAAGALMAALQDLKTATEAANKVVADARAEGKLGDQVAVFAESATRTIADAVAAKISQTDIDYSKLTASMTPASSSSTSSSSATGATGTAPLLLSPTASVLPLIAKSAKLAVGAETVEQRTQKITDAVAAITAKTAELQARISAYQLAAAETAVTACVKAIAPSS